MFTALDTRLANLWHRVRGSLWFVPALLDRDCRDPEARHQRLLEALGVTS